MRCDVVDSASDTATPNPAWEGLTRLYAEERENRSCVASESIGMLQKQVASSENFQRMLSRSGRLGKKAEGASPWTSRGMKDAKVNMKQTQS